MLRTAFPVIILLMSAVVANGQTRENTEWDVSYWYNANQDSLPRILLIGDSITRGYEVHVRNSLAGVAYVSYFTTSKCVTDRSYLKVLSYVLDEYKYSVIHFNNGLHSLRANPPDWEKGLVAALELIKEKQPDAKIILCTSTPTKEDRLTKKAVVLNDILLKINTKYKYPVNDMFAMMDPFSRDEMWGDTYHFKHEGRKMQGEQVSKFILKELGAKPASAAEAQDALKKAESETGPDGKIETVSYKNLVVNGDFNSSGGWSIYPNDSTRCSFVVVEEGHTKGSKAAKVTVIKPSAQLYQTTKSFEAGKSYSFSIKAKADKTANIKFYIRSIKPPYQYYGTYYAKLNTEWSDYKSEFKLPDDFDPKKHNLIIVLSGSATYWIDSVSVH